MLYIAVCSSVTTHLIESFLTGSLHSQQYMYTFFGWCTEWKTHPTTSTKKRNIQTFIHRVWTSFIRSFVRITTSKTADQTETYLQPEKERKSERVNVFALEISGKYFDTTNRTCVCLCSHEWYQQRDTVCFVYTESKWEEKGFSSIVCVCAKSKRTYTHPCVCYGIVMLEEVCTIVV